MENVLIPLVIILSLLMVSSIKFDTLPKFSKTDIKNKPVFHIFVILAAVSVGISEGSLLFFILVLVILFSIIRQMKNYFFNNSSDDANLN